LKKLIGTKIQGSSKDGILPQMVNVDPVKGEASAGKTSSILLPEASVT